MTTYKIAVLPGDGIGPDVTAEAIKVLEALKQQDPDFKIEFRPFEWGSEYYLEHGRIMPEDGLDQLKSFDAILFGAVGDKRVPDEITIWELIMPIRKNFQQYVNMRPIRRLAGIESPLKNEQPIDFMVFRENAEGEYSNIGGRLYQQQSQEMAIQNTVITKQGVERIAKYAFEYARKNKKSKVTSATKSNAIIHSMKLWDEVVKEVAEDYGEIELESNFIDALAAYFVMRPESFEVVVASNLFGDILTDLGAALVGGLGVSPSGNINPDRTFPSMFEAIHGSAPDIAGKGIANPIAQIWSAALMLDHLGRPDLSTAIVDAIEQVLQEGRVLTPDLGGTSTTQELGSAIAEKVQQLIVK
ncbi:tartrate dehydrogenase [Microbacterium sp. APC 3898]|uniref:D-malate dehydrogenase (decarboxylating) n=2 Tax=Planococcus TaxID=1372 RepID=A0ABT7ZMB6_9BACL|nr:MULTISPECIES: tartrate dehydrogenase [Terrabacteria group]MBD8015907.1 tartrate dehydrogenase [Planococcus wigleyi]MDN3428310.1 tartrate dehydrogenase [Planococcus sp. APC 4016]MDN3498983.1 tartrate dehydrogenase [Microbacterium sp. APC 3898]